MWQEFFPQDNARKAYQQIEKKQGIRMFAFQKTNHGMTYVLAEQNLAAAVCLGLRALPGGGGEFHLWRHGFEDFGDHSLPMKLFADCEYSVPLNMHLDRQEMLDNTIFYVRMGCTALLRANGVHNPEEMASTLVIDVETSHRPNKKVSFHLKIPRVVVRNMRAQAAFWWYVQSLIKADREADIRRAQLLTVKAPCKERGVRDESFIDMSVYQSRQGQLFRLLGASKNEQTHHFLVPQGRRYDSITPREWLASLILCPDAKKRLKVPEGWYRLLGEKPLPQQPRRHRQQLIPRTDVSSLGVAASLIFRYIDTRWKVSPESITVKSVGDGWWWLIPTRDCYCPLKGEEHSTEAAMVMVGLQEPPTAFYLVKCRAKSHPETPKVQEKGRLPWELVKAFSMQR